MPDLFNLFGSGSKTVYLCKRNSVQGIAVDNEIGTTEQNILTAQILVEECEEKSRELSSDCEGSTCPEGCQLNGLANQLRWYRAGPER